MESSKNPLCKKIIRKRHHSRLYTESIAYRTGGFVRFPVGREAGARRARGGREADPRRARVWHKVGTIPALLRMVHFTCSEHFPSLPVPQNSPQLSTQTNFQQHINVLAILPFIKNMTYGLDVRSDAESIRLSYALTLNSLL